MMPPPQVMLMLMLDVSSRDAGSAECLSCAEFDACSAFHDNKQFLFQRIHQSGSCCAEKHLASMRIVDGSFRIGVHGGGKMYGLTGS